MGYQLQIKDPAVIYDFEPRPKYVSVRVSTWIFSPWVMNSGTCTPPIHINLDKWQSYHCRHLMPKYRKQPLIKMKWHEGTFL